MVDQRDGEAVLSYTVQSLPSWGTQRRLESRTTSTSKRELVVMVLHDLLKQTLKNSLRGVGGPLPDTQLPWGFWRQRRCSMETMAVNH